MPKPVREVCVVLFVLLLGLVPVQTFVEHAVAQPSDPDTVGPPTEWVLLDIDPNPFCPETWSIAQICLEAPEAADLELVLLSPDSSTVLRVLVDTSIPGPGFFCVFWDGTDADSNELPEGLYPYRLTATERNGTEILFQDTKVATLSCEINATDATTWGSLKSRFTK